VRKLAAWLRRLYNRVKNKHYTILRIKKRLDIHEGLRVVEQLLD
jgi:hypothetical protein